jgi:hypothetical protein
MKSIASFNDICHAMPETTKHVRLAPQTLAAFDSYIQGAELAMKPCFCGKIPFLRKALSPKVSQRVREGQIPAELWSSDGPTHVPNGLIHDWIGIAFVPGAAVAETLTLIQSYDDHKEIYKPDVIDSRLLNHHGSDFRIFLRLRKKKIITVVLDTLHDVHYAQVSPNRWTCSSWTTSIREVENAGTPNETISESDDGYGYMWRLNSYWNIQKRNAGVWLECRAISLSRDIPRGLAWIIAPIIRQLPCDSLVHTLQATRQALIA